MISTILFSLGFILLLFSLIIILLLYNERRILRQRLIEERHRTLGLPAGELVYEDADGQGEPLVSNQYPLLGKPDYVVRLADGRPVPIERKPTEGVTIPRDDHAAQIAAYCLILEEYYPETPPTHGIIRYADTEFTIDYTPVLKKKVIRALEQMARCTEREPPPLARQKVVKCRACAFQPICPIGRAQKK